MERATLLLQQANKPAIREWIESLWGSVKNNPQQTYYHRVRVIEPQPKKLEKSQRASVRMPNAAEKAEIIERWGWNCAFCGIPLIDTRARKVLQTQLSNAISWGPANADKHAAFQCMTLEFDHVVPHCFGGISDVGNTVPSCGPCNCGKFDRLLEQLGLIDPRNRSISITTWDGLTRVLNISPRLRNTLS
jgi:5-methylcytosine-specific restriction endonuclease McrA